ncbi:3-hydroxyacyl-CoA dehydrogenase [Paraburkholderia sp. GAS42]|uniref:3-hydroxyacyl-CoA dehydrogenase n=1 Tax=Paraburkholderia sp. GAS42 TaxID=3035135 RepID=UPI003D1EB156
MMSDTSSQSLWEALAQPASRPVVAIAGAGSIGVAFALVFASGGFSVRLWDAFPEALPRARADLEARLALLDSHGILRDTPEAILGRVSLHADLSDAVSEAVLVQECVPEQLGLKRDLFERLGRLAPADAILASATSALQPSLIAEGLEASSRIVVAHPGNPPYLLPVIEIVPSMHTSPEFTSRAMDLYASVGMRPVLVQREVEGFIFNRLQGALLREAYCLVRDGVASVADVDEVVRSGLGRRWSVIGPFETVDLNTRGGIESHASKMGPAYERMGAERGQSDPWTADLVAEVTRQRRALLPLQDWEQRVQWRDEQLMRASVSGSSD